MKKVLAICLVLALLVPLCLTNLTVEAEKTAVKPFYGVTWAGVDRDRFPNLAGMPSTYIYWDANGEFYLYYNGKYSNQHGMTAIAMAVKESMDSRPEGMRYMQFLRAASAFGYENEDLIWLENGTARTKAVVSEFMRVYKEIGGQLDGVIMDLEYQNVLTWWIYQRFYIQDVPTIYKDIVENPRYQTEVRPLLVERGFKFWSNPSGNKSEIYSIHPYDGYEESRKIWENVMRCRLSEYLNEGIWEPLQEFFPGAHMSDYQTTDGYGWQKKLDREGGNFYLGGNITKAGDTSNLNTYLGQPSAGFYEANGNMRYLNPVAYNEAVYDPDAYAMFLWDMNRFKQMYEATDDTGRVNLWISEYDTPHDTYTNRVSNTGETGYYSELLLHAGLMNPDVFLLFIPREEREDLTDEEFNVRYQVIADCLDELTRVVGAADREPIYVPYNWNDGYVLSGMYAGGRNMWRITPDTTDGMTLEEFLVKDRVPTFKINGKTVIFPQGRIVETGKISVLGSTGYWVETPADVTPVVLTDADRYSENPSYAEDFERYDAATGFKAGTAKEKNAWEVTGSPTVALDGNNKVLSLTGTNIISNVKLPANITAGDNYAMQQAWEVSFKLPATLSSGSVNLLTCGTDSGFKISGTKLYYDKNGTATQFSGLTLTAGVEYTVRREVNFTSKTCTYVVLANGSEVAKAENIAMKSVTLPVAKIGFKTSSLGSQKIYLDDYTLYPIGFTADFEVYNADTGIKLADATTARDGDVAYRLSWLNNSGVDKKAYVVAKYYKDGVEDSSETVGEIIMARGNDGVATAIVKNKPGMTVKLILQTTDTTLAQTPEYDNGNFDWPRYEDNVVQPEDSITSSTSIIYMENERAIAGKEFKVTVSLKNNPGIAYADFNVSYDRNKLQLVSVENTGLFADFAGASVMDSPFTLSVGNAENPVNVTDDGAIAVLTFKVLAEDTCEADVVIICPRRNICNADGECVDIVAVRNTVNIEGNVPGDVNSDGLINIKDVVLMRRYLAKWENVNIDHVAADVNGDGLINIKDVVLMRRYLAKWEGVELK